MQPYTVRVHLYGPVAVLTLCAGPDRVGGAWPGEGLAGVLAGLGAGVGSVVLDLDRAPVLVSAQASAAVAAWAAGRSVTVAALTSAQDSDGVLRPGLPELRAVPGGRRSDEAARARRLRRVVAGRALVQQAAGIRQARGLAHPCP
ncbi:hypothetical protein [Streptomyces hydrogenans]|uniref:hypothetical protein n=1 Tax=Streptomyces hydrogenans TaxID=1873719 RepID=UPI0037FF271D